MYAVTYAISDIVYRTSGSILMYPPGGRLGNMISSYLMLFWLRLEHGFDVYLDRESVQVMGRYFASLDMPVLEDSLCDYRAFPWERYPGDVAHLAAPEYRTGRAVELHMPKSNYMRHEVQGGRHFYKKYKKQSRKALAFRPKYR